MSEFIVTRDGRREKVLEPQSSRFEAFKRHIQLQARMSFYDLFYGTHYRTIRNELVREKRNREFESRIGLVRTTAK